MVERLSALHGLGAVGHGIHELGYLLVLLGELSILDGKLLDERGKRWRIGSARPLGTVYLLCISVCITLCIRRLLVKRIDEPANQISLRTSSQLGNLF